MFVKIATPRFRFERLGWSWEGIKWVFLSYVYAPRNVVVNLLPVWPAIYNIVACTIAFCFALVSAFAVPTLYLLTGIRAIPVFTEEEREGIQNFKQAHGVSESDVSQRIESADVPPDVMEEMKEEARKQILLAVAHKKMMGLIREPLTREEVDLLVPFHMENFVDQYKMCLYVLTINAIVQAGQGDRLPLGNREALKLMLEDWMEKRGISMKAEDLSARFQ